MAPSLLLFVDFCNNPFSALPIQYIDIFIFIFIAFHCSSYFFVFTSFTNTSMVLKFILRLQSLCSMHKLSIPSNPHWNTSASTMFAAVVISVAVLNWSTASHPLAKRAKKKKKSLFGILVNQIVAQTAPKATALCSHDSSECMNTDWVLWVPTPINSLFRCTLPEAEGQSFKRLRYRWAFVARQLREEKSIASSAERCDFNPLKKAF